jgi:hypothetical protein
MGTAGEAHEWSSPVADPLTILGIALSALGAGGAVNPAVQAARRIRRERGRRHQTRDTPQDLFYRSICIGLRIVETDREYIHRREAGIVSRQDGLTRLPWGSRPLGDIQNVEEELVSNDPAIGLSLIEAEWCVRRAGAETLPAPATCSCPHTRRKPRIRARLFCLGDDVSYHSAGW